VKGYEVNYLKGEADNAFLMELSWYVNGLRGRIDKFVKNYTSHSCLEKLAKDIVGVLLYDGSGSAFTFETDLY
jgi:hypothetical protein